jgi:predicted Zn-dependent protease
VRHGKGQKAKIDMMQEYFYTLAETIMSLLRGSEVYTCTFHGEEADFIRFNRSTIRQPGTITQRSLHLDLIDGRRHTAGSLALSDDLAIDRARMRTLIAGLRDKLGIYAAGGIHTGFANAFGQRNWFSSYSFNADWSFYQAEDKAVKTAYADFVWNSDAFAQRVAEAVAQLDQLRHSPRTITPGRYRVYLAPAALHDVLELLGWGGFGLKEHRTKQTPLLRMREEGGQLHPAVTLIENTRDGVAPNFQEDGFIKPEQVHLIVSGRFHECLVSPRSAQEYGVPTNGASSREAPESLEMAPGYLPRAQVLRYLHTGVYINNVWYLNYSDRSACRITGMTRFATFWVENGIIQAPLNVMRFDESIYRMLGEHLVGLTSERDFILDANTYHRRSTNSSRLPGALIEAFTFTL